MIFYPVRNGRDFLFALHLLRVQGFFARKRISHAQAFTGLCSGLFVNSPYFSAHNTANTQAAYAPPAPRWRAYRQEPHLHRYQIPPTRRTPHKSAQPPIIIRYIRGAQTMPARRGLRLSCVDRWQVLCPAHLLRGQRLHLYRVSPAGFRCFSRPTVCGLALVSGQGAPGRPGTLHPAGQSSSGRRRNH